jgi:hypothetical protein
VYESGGPAAGVGYRARLGDSGTFNAMGAFSVKQFKKAEATVTRPAFANGRVSVEMRGSWLDAPTLAFYGVGNDSAQSSKTTFSYRSTTVGVSSKVQVTRLFAVGAGLDAIGIETTSPLNPTYRRTRLFAQVDSRESPRRGGLYRFDWSDYHQMNTGTSSFRRVDAEASQLVPVLRENWVIGLRALVSSTDAAAGNDVPYFLMPDLGGSHMLRGYPSWRFRGPNGNRGCAARGRAERRVRPPGVGGVPGPGARGAPRRHREEVPDRHQSAYGPDTRRSWHSDVHERGRRGRLRKGAAGLPGSVVNV